MLRRVLLKLAIGIGVALFLGAAWAQEFPSRPVKIIVPFPPGGATDALARLAADGLSPRFAQPVVVENRPGAGGGIATEFVIRSPADGYTVLVAGQGALFINKALRKDLPYDPETDLTFVGMIGSFPNVIVSHPDTVPAKSMAEFIRLAQEKPGGLSYGSNGVGSLSHLTTEMVAKEAGVKFLHVPYQGAAPQMADLLAGRIGFSIIATQTVMPLIRQGKLRALAVSTRSRYPGLADTPTLIEAGFPNLDVPVWFAIVAPTKTPAPVLARLREGLNAVVSAPNYVAELAKREAQPMPLGVEQSKALFARESRFWTDAVKTTGATAN